MKVLFIGNSHTFFNDMAYQFAYLMRAAGQQVEVTMLSRGGQKVCEHIKNEQTRFNILYGGYDYIPSRMNQRDTESLADKHNEAIKVLPTLFSQAKNTKRNIKNKRVYLAEYKKYVEQSVLYDADSRMIIGIMRDVTDEVEAKERKELISRHTVEVADKVVEKQMRIVQEIASLLGETAAETKIALTKLKESIGDE